jgi:Uma2 family endonuclease
MAVIEQELTRKIISYEDYMREVDAGVEDPCEIVDGVRIAMTAPNVRHQRISLNLIAILKSYVDEHGGEALPAPCDLFIRDNPLNVREPDILYASEATLETYGEFPETGPIKFPVDLVIEIISPTERRRDFDDKLHDYASIGVCECWIVSPEAQDVTILTLVDGVYRKFNVFSTGENLASTTLPHLELDIDKLFAPRKRLGTT